MISFNGLPSASLSNELRKILNILSWLHFNRLFFLNQDGQEAVAPALPSGCQGWAADFKRKVGVVPPPLPFLQFLWHFGVQRTPYTGKRSNFSLGQLKAPEENNKLTVMDYRKATGFCSSAATLCPQGTTFINTMLLLFRCFPSNFDSHLFISGRYRCQSGCKWTITIIHGAKSRLEGWRSSNYLHFCCKWLALLLQSRPYVIYKFPIRLHKILILYSNSVKSVKQKNDFIGFQRADVIGEQRRVGAGGGEKKEKSQSDTNHRETQWVFYEFINLRLWIYREQHYNFWTQNFTVFRIQVKHATEKKIHDTKKALTKDILLLFPRHTSSKAVVWACTSEHQQERCCENRRMCSA